MNVPADRGAAVIDLRTREVVFPPVETQPQEGELLGDLLDHMRDALSRLDPESSWASTIRQLTSLVRAFGDPPLSRWALRPDDRRHGAGRRRPDL